jgi:serine/threonine protein kinase
MSCWYRTVDVIDVGDPTKRFVNLVRIGEGASSTIYLADDLQNSSHKVHTKNTHTHTHSLSTIYGILNGSDRFDQWQWQIALKVCNITAKNKQAIAHEMAIVRSNHQHGSMIDFYGCFLAGTQQVWIALEYMNGGALQNIVDAYQEFQLNERHIAHILWKVYRCESWSHCEGCTDCADQQTLLGLEYMHFSKYQIHRDIKVCITDQSLSPRVRLI